MTDKLREAAQQALEALEAGPDVDPIFAGETEAALSAALAQQPEPVCKCDLRTRLVGDGCEICNPELAAQLAQEQADGRVVIERRDDMLYMNGSEIGPGTLEIRRDGVTYRAAERVAVQQPEPAQEKPEPKFLDTVLYTGASERAIPVKPAPPGLVGVVPITTVSVTTQHRVLTDADLDAIRKIVREGGKE